jgi:hypothetical protein
VYTRTLANLQLLPALFALAALARVFDRPGGLIANNDHAMCDSD